MAQIHSFIEQAWGHLRADRPKQAMDCAKKAHAISPDSPDVSHLLGLLASRDGKPEIALPLLQKAIDTGGKTAHRLRHMAEALLDAGYPEAALTPLNEAIKEFGASSDLLGLKSAIEIGLEQWGQAAQTSQEAMAFNPNLMAWELNLSFAQLMQGNITEGFKNATARPENLKPGSVCPALNLSEPCAIWLTGEQSVGALFYLRYVPGLVARGWQFHLEADKKLVPLLQHSPLFLSVKEKNKAPKNAFCMSLGDLPVMALQCGVTDIPPPLPLTPDSKLVEKYREELAKLGPAPYIAVTWRGGPKGRKHRSGIRALEKVIEPNLLGGFLATNHSGTIISLQRLPEADEALAFAQALGKKPADYSALNNNLAGMLALLSLVDEYYTVSNTNLHLREGLGKPSHVFVNRPFQDWRWQAEGPKSIWYPNSTVYRQEKDKTWQTALTKLTLVQTNHQKSKVITQVQTNKNELSTQSLNSIGYVKHTLLINEGWAVVANNIPEAIIKAQEVLKENPKNARALHLLGWAAIQDLKFDLGASLLQQATTIEPQNGNIWRDFIRANIILEKTEEAIRIGQECLENPVIWGKGVIHFAIGIAYSQLDNDIEALKHFETCSTLIPSHLEAPTAAGLTCMRLGDGYALKGFKLNTSRVEARAPSNYPVWICPILKGDIQGLKVLIVRSMGIGDELSYLRYLPYLINAGAKVTYWSGAKLAPSLVRLPINMTVIPDTEPMPDPSQFDLAFIKNELPIAVEHFGAPEIAESLPLLTDPKKLEKWRAWLHQQGDGPYLGLTWSAGAAGIARDGFSLSRLSKKIEPANFANALKDVRGTLVSLTRNITKLEHEAFERCIGRPVIDVAGLTDDIDDLLCIQQLLNENIGVSNTNMHLRASLGLPSKVLVSLSSRDWRWGVSSSQSTWFKSSKVYRESKQGGWQACLDELKFDLIARYGKHEDTQSAPVNARIINSQLENQALTKSSDATKKIIWVNAGEIKRNEGRYYSALESTQERVVNIADLLTSKGWHSDFLNENVSVLMGGWHDKLPVEGDVVVFSKVFTEHAIKLMHDARARGASVMVDVFNDFESQPERALHQQKMMQAADVVVSSPKLQLKWQRLSQPIAFYFNNVNEALTQQEIEQITQDWLTVLENPNDKTVDSPAQAIPVTALTHNLADQASCTKRLIWLTDGNLTTVDGHLSSDMASTRYRVLTPAKSLQAYGWQSEIIIEYESKSLGGWGKTIPQPGDILIISKVFTEHALSLVFDAKKRGVKVLLDICDNHLNHSKLGGIQKSLIEMADHIVTSTRPLKEALENIGKQADAVISDPVEFRRGEIKFEPSKVLELLWFGHPVNIDTLAEITPKLAILAQTLPLHLSVVTKLRNGQQDLDKIIPAGLTATFIPWTLNATQEAIENCDMVIIPTVQNDFKNSKSPNRLLEPLWAGRMVVAGPLPAYLHFADSAWVGKDIIEGIQWCLANPDEVKKRIAQGQSDIEKYFTKQSIGQQWHQLISETQAIKSQSQPKAEPVSPLADYLQVAEVARILATQETNTSIITQQYYQFYPVKYKLDTPKIAVYTAIFGGYDTAPILNHSDPQLDYILYTDQADFNAPAPWQIRVVPSMFADPQMDARRVKVLSHLFLADYDISVWIDGNFTLEKLTHALITDIASRAPVALCKHQFRNCIYDEAVEILKRGIDASTPVLKQMQYYQAHDFPRQYGLHATSFLVRNHQEADTIKLNMRWWEVLSTNSKRDQLSFDYVRWEQSAPIMTLPWNLRENRLYFWGKNGERNHKIDLRRNDEHEGRALNYQTMPTLKAHVYQPTFDQWHALFVKDLIRLNQVLINQTGSVNPSVLYAQSTKCAQSLPDVRLGELQRETLNKLTHAKRILQIGFDGGHLALMAIHHSGAKMVVVDANLDSYKQSGLEYLTKSHAKRCAIFSMQDIAQIDEAMFDLVFVNECESNEYQAIINKVKQLSKTTIFGNFRYHSSVSDYSVIRPNQSHDQSQIDESKFTKSTYGIWLKNRKGDLTWKFAVQGKYGFFYADWLKKQPESIFIDIGANIGLYSLIASTNKNFQSIYSFEPHPETFQYLIDNIAVNDAHGCTPHKLAISNKSETQTIHTKANHSGVATLREVKASEGYQSAIKIECIDAEDLNPLIKNPDNLPICIKIDVEGFELVVIQTLRQTDFWPNVTNIYYEVDESYLDYKKVEEILISEGFIFEAKNGQDQHYDLLFIRQHTAHS